MRQCMGLSFNPYFFNFKYSCGSCSMKFLNWINKRELLERGKSVSTTRNGSSFGSACTGKKCRSFGLNDKDLKWQKYLQKTGNSPSFKISFLFVKIKLTGSSIMANLFLRTVQPFVDWWVRRVIMDKVWKISYFKITNLIFLGTSRRWY